MEGVDGVVVLGVRLVVVGLDDAGADG